MEMTWTIGNTCRPISETNRFSWKLFVDCEDQRTANSVESIVIHLHPTFKPCVHSLQLEGNGQRFTSRLFHGWGIFEVGIEIIFHDRSRVNFAHMLSFDREITSQQVIVHVPAPANLDDMIMDADPTTTRNSAEVLENAPPSFNRDEFLDAIKDIPFLGHTDPRFMHGRAAAFACSAVTQDPECTWKCTKPPRDDHEAPNWLTGSEFNDQPACKQFKCKQLADMLRASKKTVVYSGAGISVAAGIGQAARGNFRASKGLNALPTVTHFCLAKLANHGMLHGWVQQNHDGLPQKAGFPQEDINEVHGAWFDPSNPVVKYSGSLKTFNYDWMVRDASDADLVLVVGTSMGGLNADQVGLNAADRSKKGQSMGMCMINLQQTEHDGKSSLRIFGKTDEIFPMVLDLLGVPFNLEEAKMSLSPPTNLCIQVPYDKKGKRSNRHKIWLDLRPGAQVKITPGHNIQGAQQPGYMHIGASKPIVYHDHTRAPAKGEGTVGDFDPTTFSFPLLIEGAHMRLGGWWLDAALRGGPATLPDYKHRLFLGNRDRPPKGRR